MEEGEVLEWGCIEGRRGFKGKRVIDPRIGDQNGKAPSHHNNSLWSGSETQSACALSLATVCQLSAQRASKPRSPAWHSRSHAIEKVAVYSTETMVIQWTHQISDVLKRDSAQLILQGKHPGPANEIEFWLQQKENLLSIYDQLQNPKIRKVMDILKRIRSSYYHSFKELTSNVKEALAEAQDIELHLTPLKVYVACLEESNFLDLERFIEPLFHIICLIWTHSKYYCMPGRLVVLLQKFCNLLIDQTFAYLIPEEVFKMDLQEGMEKIQQAIHLFEHFKKTFFVYKEKIANNYINGREAKLWDFPSQLVFCRFDKVLERLLLIEELFTSAIDFLKLERIEIGGLRGKILSEEIHLMKEEFHEIWRVLQESKYDPLDYANMRQVTGSGDPDIEDTGSARVDFMSAPKKDPILVTLCKASCFFLILDVIQVLIDLEWGAPEAIFKEVCALVGLYPLVPTARGQLHFMKVDVLVCSKQTTITVEGGAALKDAQDRRIKAILK
ncbi:dynein heavy chain 11, axonemal-like [Rhinatrema bivittatum]|uniref:dynein heavy chain 11, axonemal-like n=1 Tax=Rhinatrema bivittatum TaxID=194408 RepID=UPI001128CA84|nr:dynein heavy chain 11, axonemal-like [Rhinatrema bivittatum]